MALNKVIYSFLSLFLSFLKRFPKLGAAEGSWKTGGGFGSGVGVGDDIAGTESARQAQPEYSE